MAMPVGFTVPAVADAVAAATPDRELIIQGDDRYTYAGIVDRSKRLASYLHTHWAGHPAAAARFTAAAARLTAASRTAAEVPAR